MPDQRASRVGRFIVRVLLWLPPCFALWYIGGTLFTVPLRWLVGAVMRVGFGDIVSATLQNGSALDFVTTLRPGSATTASAASGVIEIDVGTLTYTYGLPLLAAMILAVPRGARARQLLFGYLGLLPFHAWSIAADALKQVAITMGPAVASQTDFSAFQRELIVFAYQFGTLILPAVVPVVIWVLLNRAFVEGLLEAPAVVQVTAPADGG
jgi:hypothetical protein